MSKLKNARKWIAKSVALVMTVSVATPSLAFAAIDTTGHWAEATLETWQSEGLISGYEDGTLRPDAPITRAEFVQLINKSLGFTEAGAVSFSDVKEGDWFYNGVAIAMGAKYCSGYPDGTFQPNAQVTRAQAAGFVANAAGLSANAEAAAEMKDSANLPSWAAGAIGGVLSAGFMSGYPDGTFAADKVLTRAEAVSTLDRVKNGATAEDDKTTSEDDVTISEDGETLQNVEVAGDVIVSEAIGNGNAFIKNVQIGGDLIIEGGGSKSVHVADSEISGAVNVKKEGVRVVFEGSTSAPEVNLEKAAKLEASQNFTGSVDTINVPDALGTGTTSVIKVAADTLNLDGKSSVQIAAAIDTINVAADAADSKIEVISGIKVNTIVADGKIALNGSGTVKKLMANVSGITKTSSITVSSTETATGVDKPSTSGGGGGGSSSSSSSSSDDKPKVKSIALVSGPTQLSYTDGDTLKLDGLKVNLVRTNGTKLEVAYANFAANGLSVTPADGTKLTTSYNDTVIKVTHSVGTVNAGTIKVTGGTVTPPDPTPDPDEEINTAAELKAAIEEVEAGSNGSIQLGGNISGTTTATFNGNGTLTIDLNGFTLEGIDLTADTATAIDFVDNGAAKLRMAKAAPKIKNIKVKAPNATVTTSTTVTTITITEAKEVAVDGTVETVTVETKTAVTSTTISGAGSIGTVAANSTVTVTTTTVTNVTASAPVTLNIAVEKVTVPEAATDVTIAGSGNIANIESNATESVIVNTTGKVDSIAANGPVTATATGGIGSVAAAAPVTLNSAVETVTVPKTATGVTVTTTSTISSIKTETNVTIAGSGKVTTVEVDSTTNVTVTVGNGSTVDTVVDTGAGGTVSTDGDGTVTNGVATIKSLAVKTDGKTSYTVGEAFDLTGWVVEATYSYPGSSPDKPDDTKEITLTASMVNGFDSSNVGTNNVTFTYGGKTTEARTITIGKATPVVATAVTATPVVSGQALSTSTLSGTFKVSATNSTPVAGELTWTTPATVVSAEGSQNWTFTPTISADYETVTGTVNVALVDTTALDAAIAAANALTSADYTTASYKAVTDALALPETTQAEITAKTTAITTAVTGLVFAGKADLDAAKAELAKIPADNTAGKYTADSWTAYTAAIATANALPETTNAEIVAKTAAITAAIALLVETTPTTPQTIAQAKTAAEAAVKALAVTNATDAAAVLAAANGAITNNAITASWKTGAEFAKTEATTAAAGSITGTIEIKQTDQATLEIVLDLTIAKLSDSSTPTIAATVADSGTLTAGTAGTVEYTITTTNLPTVAAGSVALAWVGGTAPAGVTTNVNEVAIANGTGTLTISGDTTTEAGTPKFTLTAGGATSEEITLNIVEAGIPEQTPVFTVTDTSNTATKDLKADDSVEFTLGTAAAATDVFAVYDANDATTASATVKATASGTALTLALITPNNELPAKTYYVTIKATDKTESTKVALIVADPTESGTGTITVAPAAEGDKLIAAKANDTVEYTITTANMEAVNTNGFSIEWTAPTGVTTNVATLTTTAETKTATLVITGSTTTVTGTHKFKIKAGSTTSAEATLEIVEATATATPTFKDSTTMAVIATDAQTTATIAMSAATWDGMTISVFNADGTTAATGITSAAIANGVLTITGSANLAKSTEYTIKAIPTDSSTALSAASAVFKLYSAATDEPVVGTNVTAAFGLDTDLATMNTLTLTHVLGDLKYAVAATAATKITESDWTALASGTATIASTDLAAGNVVKVRFAQDDTTGTLASAGADLYTIAAAPEVTLAVPTSNGTEGKTALSGSTTDMQYKLNDEGWKNATEDMEIAVSKDDVILIRTAAVGTTPASLTKELTVENQHIKPFALGLASDAPTAVTNLASATTSAVIADSKTTAHAGDTVKIEITVGGDNSEATAQTVTITPKSASQTATDFFTPVSGTVEFAAKSGETNGAITTTSDGKLTFTFTMPKADVTDLTFTATTAATVE